MQLEGNHTKNWIFEDEFTKSVRKAKKKEENVNQKQQQSESNNNNNNSNNTPSDCKNNSKSTSISIDASLIVHSHTILATIDITTNDICFDSFLLLCSPNFFKICDFFVRDKYMDCQRICSPFIYVAFYSNI